MRRIETFPAGNAVRVQPECDENAYHRPPQVPRRVRNNVPPAVGGGQSEPVSVRVGDDFAAIRQPHGESHPRVHNRLRGGANLIRASGQRRGGKGDPHSAGAGAMIALVDEPNLLRLALPAARQNIIRHLAYQFPML